MARNYDQYPIEELRVRTLIFHAKDDKLASYQDMAKASARFPDSRFVSFEDGGHKMAGHAGEVISALEAFMG